MLLLRLNCRKIVKRWQGQNCGEIFVYYIFYNFYQMFCGTLANKIINKIIKSVFKLEIQIFIQNHPSPPPNKSKGKSTTAVYTISHIQTKNSQRSIQSCPPNRNDDCLPCFLYKSFFYAGGLRHAK